MFTVVTPFLLHLLALANAWSYWGIDLTSNNVITVDQAKTLLNGGNSVFYGTYFDGRLVSNPNSVSGLFAGVYQNMDISIKNVRNASFDPVHIDAIHIPQYTTQKSLSVFGYPPGCQNNICVQGRLPIDYLNSNGGAITRTWFYISRYVGSNWSTTSQSANRAFMTKLLSYFPGPASNFLGPQPGILSNKTEYEAIFGTSYTLPLDTNGNAIPLFWINCPNAPNFDSSTQFGGFTTSTLMVMRYVCQENSGSNVAGSGVDANMVVA